MDYDGTVVLPHQQRHQQCCLLDGFTCPLNLHASYFGWARILKQDIIRITNPTFGDNNRRASERGGAEIRAIQIRDIGFRTSERRMLWTIWVQMKGVPLNKLDVSLVTQRQDINFARLINECLSNRTEVVGGWTHSRLSGDQPTNLTIRPMTIYKIVQVNTLFC